MLLPAIPATIPLIQNVGIEMQRAMDKHRFRSIACLIMAALNLAVSIYLCRIWGPAGCALGTGASMILANGLIMSVHCHRHCNTDTVFFWKGILLPFAVFAAMTHFHPVAGSLRALAPWIGAYTAFYAACLRFISMKPCEKGLVRRFVGKVRK